MLTLILTRTRTLLTQVCPSNFSHPFILVERKAKGFVEAGSTIAIFKRTAVTAKPAVELQL